MKQITKTILLCLALLMMGMGASAQGLKAFKLRNGLSVFIWEDESKPDVFGLVGVPAGSINEPSDYTGLAHYLEHVMFKGTTLIGSLDWAQEEPLYKEIIAKYDDRGAACVGNIDRFKFYDEAKDCYCILQTGETAIYANIILQKGVIK